MAGKLDRQTLRASISALLDEGLSYRAIAKKLDCSQTTIASVNKDRDGVDLTTRGAINRARAEMFRKKAEYILDSVTEEDIEKASLKDKVISAGILSQRASEIEAGTTGATHNHLHISGLMEKIGSNLNMDKVKEIVQIPIQDEAGSGEASQDTENQ